MLEDFDHLMSQELEDLYHLTNWDNLEPIARPLDLELDSTLSAVRSKTLGVDGVSMDDYHARRQAEILDSLKGKLTKAHEEATKVYAPLVETHRVPPLPSLQATLESIGDLPLDSLSNPEAEFQLTFQTANLEILKALLPENIKLRSSDGHTNDDMSAMPSVNIAGYLAGLSLEDQGFWAWECVIPAVEANEDAKLDLQKRFTAVTAQRSQGWEGMNMASYFMHLATSVEKNDDLIVLTDLPTCRTEERGLLSDNFVCATYEPHANLPEEPEAVLTLVSQARGRHDAKFYNVLRQAIK
jgi:hypothetical protein